MSAHPSLATSQACPGPVTGAVPIAREIAINWKGLFGVFYTPIPKITVLTADFSATKGSFEPNPVDLAHITDGMNRSIRHIGYVFSSHVPDRHCVRPDENGLLNPTFITPLPITATHLLLHVPLPTDR